MKPKKIKVISPGRKTIKYVPYIKGGINPDPVSPKPKFVPPPQVTPGTNPKTIQPNERKRRKTKRPIYKLNLDTKKDANNK